MNAGSVVEAERGRRARPQAAEFLKDAVLTLPRVLQLLYRLLKDPRVSRADKLLLAALAAYVVTPVDFVPDFIPLAGQVDDLFAVALVLLRLVGNSGPEILKEHWTGPPDILPWIRNVARFSKVFLPDRVVQTLFARFGDTAAPPSGSAA